MHPRAGLSIVAALACIIVATAVGDGYALRATKYTKVPEKQVDVKQKDLARTIASSILKGWREGKFEPFPDDFDDEVKKISTPEAQKKAAHRIKELFGEYKGLEYFETATVSIMPGVVFYRFKGTFSGTKENPEVLMVFDAKGKITGFWVKPWDKDAH